MSTSEGPLKTASPADRVAPSATPSARVPDHELLRRIGHGSYGEVWLARSATGAYRAVKIVYRHSFDNDRPFEREFSGILKFEPISRRHESQVDILHVGREENCFYYVMELADDQFTGQFILPATYAPKTLKSELCHRGRLPFEECVRISLALTTALEHLHAHGLVHRDVKPSNIIFVNGVPKLADIGLVTGVDATRSLVGTEGFTAPEGPGTPQADLYSLGKVLYEICTGKDRGDFPELPTHLAELPDCEGLVELNAVIGKACREEPRARYRSAKAMHDELLILQSGKSLARLRKVERALGRLKRASLAITVVSILAVAAWWYQSRQAQELSRLAASNLKLAQRARQMTEESRARLLQLQVANAIPLLDQGNLLDSLLWLAEAYKTAAHDPAQRELHQLRIASVLEQSPKLAHLFRHDGPVLQTAFSPDGVRLASATTNGITVFALSTRQQLLSISETNRISGLAFSTDGKSLLVTIRSREAGIHVFDAHSGQSVLPAHVQEAVAVSPDGLVLVERTSTNKWRLVHARTGEALSAEIETGNLMLSAEFSRDGRRLLVGSTTFGKGLSGDLDFWDVSARQKIGSTITISAQLVNWALSPDGAQVLTTKAGASKPELRLWNIDDGQEITAFQQDISADPELGRFHIGFSPDGRWTLAASARELRMWDAKTGLPVGSPLKQTDVPVAAAVSPDGLLLATAAEDNLVRVWDPFTGKLAFAPLRSGKWVRSIQFSPDGRFLAIGGDDRLVRIWDLAGCLRPERVIRLPATLSHAAFSPDGQKLLSTGWQGRIWDVQSGAALAPVFEAEALLGRTCFSPDGRQAASYTGPRYVNRGFEFKGVWVWDTKTAALLYPPLVSTAAVYHAEFSRDGSRIVTASAQSRSGRVWDAKSGQALTPPLEHPGPVYHAALSPDGRRVVTAGWDGTARLWDSATGQRLLEPLSHGAWVFYAGFSPDGTKLVTTTQDQTVRIWSAATGQPLTPPLFHRGEVRWAAFSPDGRLLLTAASTPEVRLWQWDNPDPLLAILLHPEGPISAASFSADSTLVFSTSFDGTARVWHSASGEPLTPFLRQPGGIRHGEFSPRDNGLFVTAGDDKKIRVWRLKRWPQGPTQVTQVAQLLSGHRLGMRGSLRALEAEELVALFDSLRSQHGDLFVTPATQVAAWHGDMAELAARSDQWQAVLWRLNEALAIEPANAHYLALRGTAQAELGHWPPAQSDFAAALELDRSDIERWADLAVARLGGGDAQGFGKVCAQALEHFRDGTNPQAIRGLAELCKADSAGFANPAELVSLTSKAREQWPTNPFYLRAHAITAYRVGDHETAAAELERYRSSGFGPRMDLLGGTYLVLANLRLGKTADAWKLWKDLGPRMEEWQRNTVALRGPNWSDRIITRLSLQELKALGLQL